MRLDERFAAKLAALQQTPAPVIGDHITPIRMLEGDLLQAYCTQHGALGRQRRLTLPGMRAVIDTARAHDDAQHGVYRTDAEYRRDVTPPG